MLTFESDPVAVEFKTKVEQSLIEVDYEGPMKKTEGLLEDLVPQLLGILFDFLDTCINRSRQSNKVIARRAKNIRSFQQYALDNRIRRQVFRGSWNRYNAAGGDKISDALIVAGKATSDEDMEHLVSYVREESEGVTVHGPLTWDG